MNGLAGKAAVLGVMVWVSAAAMGLNLQVTPANLSFTAYEGGEDPAAQTITIRNKSSVTQDWQIVDANDVPSLPGWLVLSTLSGSLDPNGMPGSSCNLTVGIDVDQLAAGYRIYEFYVLASGAERHTISLTLQILGPSMQVSPTSFSASIFYGSTELRTWELTVSNAGGGVLGWVFQDEWQTTFNPPAWLSVSATSGQVPIGQSQTVILSCNPAGLAVGAYQYKFQIASPGVLIKTLTVNLWIIGPALYVSGTSFSFSSAAGGSNPPVQTFIVKNTGGGSLDWSIDTAGQPDWLTITPLNGSLLNNETETVTLSADITGLAAGNYTWSCMISAPGATGSPRLLNINLAVDFEMYDWSTNPGMGEPDNPYQISTPIQLMSIGVDPVLVTKHYVLTADIDMSPYGGSYYRVIGNSSSKFTGSFDGNGFVILNLSYATTMQYAGLFGYVQNAVLRNISLENVNISGKSYTGALAGAVSGGTVSNCCMTGSVGGSGYVGGLVGYSITGCVLSKCHSAGIVSATSNYAGGLCGRNEDTSIVDCYSTADVSGQNYDGGLCGIVYLGTIQGCSSSGNVTVCNSSLSHGCIGGLCGYNYQNTISDSYSTGNVTAPQGNHVGGLCGYNEDGKIMDCYATGSISGREEVGGLCGCSTGTSSFVTRCSASGAVNGYRYVGGLCGRSQSSNMMECHASGNVASTEHYAGGLCGYSESSFISQCYALGNISGVGGVGGLCGRAGGDSFFGYRLIEHCYAAGTVTGSFGVGGLCGLIGYIQYFENCYAAAAVSGTGSYIGGFVGEGYQYCICSGCFWDIQASGRTTGMGSSNIATVKGLSTAMMKSFATFASAKWDSSAVWEMPQNDYPRLQWQMGAPDNFLPDFDRDGIVDLIDYEILAEHWLLDCPVRSDCAGTDLDRSEKVDMEDLSRFTYQWQTGSEPNGMVWVFIEDPGVSGYMDVHRYISKYETTNAQYCEFLNVALATGDIAMSGQSINGAAGSNSGTDYVGKLYYDLAGPGYSGDGATNGGKARIIFADGVFSVEADSSSTRLHT